MNNGEKISTVILVILGVVLLVVSLLELFSIGTNQNNFISMGYFGSFLMLSSQFKSISKNKFVIIPFYLVLVLRLILFILKVA